MSHKSRRFMRLRALKLSCSFFSRPRPLFSIVCGLFYENTRCGIPLSDLHGSHLTSHNSRPSCAKTQKCPPVSPLPATLTHSLSRNPSVCHSYANTRGVGITAPKFFAPGLQFSTVDCKLPSALTTFRINTCISVASKRLDLPLESTLMKKGGEGGGVCAHSVNSAVSQPSPRLSPSETNNLQLKTVNSRPWALMDTCSLIDTLFSQGRSCSPRPERQNSLVPQPLAPLACVSRPGASDGAAIAPLSSVVFHAAIRAGKRPLSRGCRTLFSSQDDHGA